MSDEARVKAKRINYYLILDIVPGASHNEILHAYNRAKNTYSGGSLASYTLMESADNSSIMEEIEESFKILGNPAKRREYDVEMGFNTWSDDPEHKPQDLNPADLLGRQKKAKPVAISTPSTTSSLPISSLAASISSIGDMSFEGDVVPTATVIQMKPPAAPVPLARVQDRGHVGGVEFEPNPEFEKQMASVTSVDGPFLKATRIYRRYTPEALALRCKLSTAHVLTLENEDISSMHQPVYLRGHVFLICQALDLPNPDLLAKNYVARMVEHGKLQKRIF